MLFVLWLVSQLIVFLRKTWLKDRASQRRANDASCVVRELARGWKRDLDTLPAGSSTETRSDESGYVRRACAGASEGMEERSRHARCSKTELAVTKCIRTTGVCGGGSEGWKSDPRHRRETQDRTRSDEDEYVRQVCVEAVARVGRATRHAAVAPRPKLAATKMNTCGWRVWRR